MGYASHRWQPLNEVFLKLNINGAILYGFSLSGMEGVARDHDGCAWVAALHKFSKILSPALVEVKALVIALKWLKRFLLMIS